MTFRERFWSKVDVRGPDECWPWHGATDKDGYGRFDLQRTPKRIRRNASGVALQLWIGPFVGFPMHSCDNPPCCNPSHLSPGDNFQNMRQMVARGRYNGRFVATEIRKVRRIRAAYESAPRGPAASSDGWPSVSECAPTRSERSARGEHSSWSSSPRGNVVANLIAPALAPSLSKGRPGPVPKLTSETQKIRARIEAKP